MSEEVRVIRDDEVEAFVKTIENAFGHALRASDIPVFRSKVQVDRMHAAFDGDHLVGTAGVYPFNWRIPGGEIAAAGVTMVGVLPSHRRRGLLTKMMRAQLDDVHRREEPVAILWASEESIYQRFGYGMTSNHGRISIERSRARFLNDPGPVGRPRMMSRDEALKVLPSIYERVRATTPGMYERSATWWDAHSLYDSSHIREGASALFFAIVEIEGTPEAYTVYRMRSKWAPDGTPQSRVEVEEAIATTPEATRELWRYLFGIDLVEKIIAEYLPADFPLLLMVEEPRRLRFSLGESLWLRLVDIPAALSARSYEHDEPIVFEVGDDFCPWNQGRWRLDPGSRKCEKTEADPDLRLAVAALGAAYMGESTFARLARAGRVEEATPGAVRKADAAFRVDKAPWCPENF